MSVCVIRWAACVLYLGLPVAALCQQSSEPSAPAPGSAISTPLSVDRQLDLSRYEIPELAGAEVARGSFLVNGRLPNPVADYSATVGEITQRISIFDNGIVAVNMRGAGGTIRKKIMLPPDALNNYRNALSAEALIDEPRPPAGPNRDKALLRIYRQDGSYAERVFNPTLIQSATLGKPLAILNDLLRALSEDREASNTLTGYRPKVGDQLISDDEQTYRVVRVLQDGDFVELMSTRNPMTLYVATKDLHQYFIGKRKFAKPDE